MASSAAAQSGGGSSGTEDPARLEEARERYRSGVNAFRARRFGEAVVEFERSFRLRPHPATLYNAAEARLRAGDRERAIEQLRDLLAMTSPAPDEATAERARILAREAGVQHLEPAAAQQECPACPVCPVCPPQRECSEDPSPRVAREDRNLLPWALAGGGAVALAVGAGFYAAALSNAAAYADPRLDTQQGIELRRDLAASGEVFRWVGLTGMVLGVGAGVGAVYLLTRPASTTADRSANRTQPTMPTARLDVMPNGLLVSGTF
jgi:hypothetical protein